MGYVYAAMWFLIGLILIFRMSRENKIFYFAGGYFILLGCWWMANTLMPSLHLFTGTWGIALRVITGIALVAFCVVFFKDYQKGAAANKQKSVEQKGSASHNGGDKS